MRSLRCMVAEDEPLLQITLESILTDCGCNICAVCSSRESALRVAETTQLDLAIIDYWLGQDSADDVIAVLRSRGVPVILASGISGRDVLKAVLENAGALAAIVEKPYCSATIVSTIREVVLVPSHPCD